MQTLNTKLHRSRRAFVRHGEALLGHTAKAGKAFAGDTRQAGLRFATFAAKEARDWQGYLADRRREIGARVRDGLSIGEVEQTLLVRLARLLEELQGLVSRRLDALQQGDMELLAGYETMTARAIVARLGDLGQAQCRAIYELEQSRKRRATVLRALEQRMAA